MSPGEKEEKNKISMHEPNIFIFSSVDEIVEIYNRHHLHDLQLSKEEIDSILAISDPIYKNFL